MTAYTVASCPTNTPRISKRKIMRQLFKIKFDIEHCMTL
jgi:hypothetical protein